VDTAAATGGNAFGAPFGASMGGAGGGPGTVDAGTLQGVERYPAPVDVASPAPLQAWHEVLDSDPGATALQTPEYFAAVREVTGGSDASILYRLEDGRRVVLPLVRQRSVLGTQVLADYPGGLGHGSALASGGLRSSDVRMLVDDLRTRSALSIRIGGGHHTAEQWAAGLGAAGTVEEPRSVYVVDISRGWEAHLRAGVAGDVRYHLRRAERRGVCVEVDTTDRLIPVFHGLYRAWVDRWAAQSDLPRPVARYRALREEPYAKFATVAAALGARCRTFIAWHDGVPVAGCITLVHGDHAIGWRSYSIKELAAPVSANTLVQARAIADAAAYGCRVFDLGQTGGVPGLEAYKRSLGGVPRRVVDLRIERRTVSLARQVKTSALHLAAAALAQAHAHLSPGAADPRSRTA
jgi:CelD/BcsL family acetyltransferase involved in cellulose biosynthesis